jgi:catechol 2,3-dioxygenase-like lactoylglutathione lyase family enzyme
LALVRRLDHVILCGRDLREWVPLVERVLALQPARGLEGDDWGFSNAEFDVGDGFIGLVEPAGQDSQLHRFLARFPEGFYGMSVDVGDIGSAGAFLQARGVPFREAMRNGQVSQLWLAPSTTGGLLYQLTGPLPQVQGANPEYLGISRVVVLVEDLEQSVAVYRQCFGLEPGRYLADDRLGGRGVELSIPGSSLGDSIVLMVPAGDGPAATQLAERGPGMLEFTIEVRALDAEVRRLEAAGVGFAVEDERPGTSPARAWIDPDALRGVRVELRQAGAGARS